MFLDAARAARPRSCRASCRSATSTRTSSSSPRPRAAIWRRPRSTCRRRSTPLERRLLLAELIVTWAQYARRARRRRHAAGRQHAGGGAGAGRRPGAADRRHDDAARSAGTSSTSWCRDGRSRRILATDAATSCKFVRERWPQILQERGAIEPAARRDKLIAAEAARLAASDAPVIAAGSTGSMPATATLLATIAQLPHGAWCCPASTPISTSRPGRRLPAATASDCRPSAIRSSPCRRCSSASASRATQVEQLVAAASREDASFRRRCARPAAPSNGRRRARISRRPAAAALSSITLIEAANAEEEALAIAVALREAANTPGKTAALVTPDRALARRVLAALERWNVPVDDSGGDALADTPAGVFARLAAEAALGGLAPVPLLALLKHPLLRLGAPADAHARAVAALERAVLRGPRPKAGSRRLGACACDLSRRTRRRLCIATIRARLVSERATRRRRGAGAGAGRRRSRRWHCPRDSLPLATLAARHRDCVDRARRRRRQAQRRLRRQGRRGAGAGVR